MITQLAMLAAPLAAPAPVQGTPIPGNIVEVAEANGNFTTLVAALQATGLDAALDGSQTSERFTVFAPTDAAFASLPAGSTVPELLADPTRLTDILLYHVSAGGLLSGNVLASTTIDTLNGQRIDVSLQGTAPFVDQSQLVITDILTANGVIHVIDRVLIPVETNLVETAQSAQEAIYLTHLLEFLPQLESTLATGGEFTVFAPTNAAFQQIPATTLRSLVGPQGLPTLADILSVHVVPGRLFADEVIAAGSLQTVGGNTLPVTVVNNNVFVDGVLVLFTDIETANGNIHFIDEVLMP